MNEPELDDTGMECIQPLKASRANPDFADPPHPVDVAIDIRFPFFVIKCTPGALYGMQIHQLVAGADIGVDSDSESVLEENAGHRLSANLPAGSCDGRWSDMLKLDLVWLEDGAIVDQVSHFRREIQKPMRVCHGGRLLRR